MKQTVEMGKASATNPRRPGRPVGGHLEVGREQVLDAAERVIARDGAGASIDAVAQEAGVTKPIVYDRIGGRADLADALAARLSDRMVAASASAIATEPGFTKESLTHFIEASLEVVSQHRNLFLYVTGGTTDQTALGRLTLAERSTTPMTAVLAQWRTGLGQDPEVARAWAFGIVGMLQMLSLWWLTQEERPAAAVATQISELLWHGLPGQNRSS